MKLLPALSVLACLLLLMAAGIYCWRTQSQNLGPGITTAGQVSPAVQIHLAPDQYLVKVPVKQVRTKTVEYTQMVVKEEQKTEIDPESGQLRTFTVKNFVPKTRTKEVSYTFTQYVTSIRKR